MRKLDKRKLRARRDREAADGTAPEQDGPSYSHTPRTSFPKKSESAAGQVTDLDAAENTAEEKSNLEAGQVANQDAAELSESAVRELPSIDAASVVDGESGENKPGQVASESAAGEVPSVHGRTNAAEKSSESETGQVTNPDAVGDIDRTDAHAVTVPKPPKAKKPKTVTITERKPDEKIEPPKKGTMVLNFALSAKQREALNASEKFLMYGGAKGGGKSWFLCVWMFLMAMKYRGNKLFFCRRRSVDFTNTTLETWRKSIPANLYRINEQKKKIYVDCVGSVIDYGGLDDPLLIQSLNSAEYAHIGVDQAEEVERDSFSMLRGTMRHRLPDNSCPPYQIRLTANPAQCWLKEAFILNPQDGFRYIPALPTDNPHLPKDYVENLADAFKHRPQLLAAYLHGSWDDLAGHDVCIQQSWIEDARDKPSYGNAIKRVVVNDPARFGDDENVIYVMELTNVYRIVEMIVLEHKSLMETAGRLSAIRKKHDAQIIAVDPIGIGAGIVDALFELREPILAVNASSKPTIETNEKRYANLRSQLWMEAGLKFSRGQVTLGDDYTLAGQLGSAKFKFTSNGRIQVEAKDEIKRRIGASPDRADTLLMGFHALDYVERLDDAQYREAAEDRQGFGERVNNKQEEYVGAGDDYSGYNF